MGAAELAVDIARLRAVVGGQVVLDNASQLDRLFRCPPLSEAATLRQRAQPLSHLFDGPPPATYQLMADTNREKKYVAKLFELRDRLLSFGGNTVLMPGLEDDLLNLLRRGQVWSGGKKGQPAWPGCLPLRCWRGATSQCHMNSAQYWGDHREDDVFLATGYALSTDGGWYQHSWCIEVPAPGQARVVESTESRLAYFGFVFSEEEANQFYFDNL